MLDMFTLLTCRLELLLAIAMVAVVAFVGPPAWSRIKHLREALIILMFYFLLCLLLQVLSPADCQLSVLARALAPT